MTNVGIDYSLGRSNVNTDTGIHYGVISQHSVASWFYDEIENDYPKHECTEDDCKECEYAEPIGWHYEKDGYKLVDCLDSDIFVLESPFYTFAQYCSPCVPGAGNLDTFVEDGVKTYCLGHDWFEDGKAPYPVWRVSDGKQVIAEE